jgi:tetratricopeptide (TPR) repeat protein
VIIVFFNYDFAISKNSRLKEDKLTSLISTAKEYEKNSFHYKAIDTYNEALKIASNLSRSNDECFIYNRIGYLLFKEKKLQEAKCHYNKSILKDSTSQTLADSYLNLSLIHRRLNNKDSLLICLEKSLLIYKQLTPSTKKFEAYLKAGILYKNEGYYDKSISYLLEAYVGFEENDKIKKKATTCNTIGATQRLLRNYEISEKYYKEGLRLRISDGDSLGISNSYNNLANLFKALEKYDSAIIYYTKGINMQESFVQTREKGRMLSNLASTYYLKNDYTLASKIYKKALIVKKKEKDSISIAYTLNELALIATKNKDYISAKKHLDTCLSYLYFVNNKDAVLRFYEVNAIYYKQTNNTQ